MLLLRSGIISSLLNPKVNSYWPSSSVWHRRPCPSWNTFFTCLLGFLIFLFSSHLIHQSFSVSLAGFSSSFQHCNVKYHRAYSSILLSSLHSLSLVISYNRIALKDIYINNFQICISSGPFPTFQTWIASCLLNISMWLPKRHLNLSMSSFTTLYPFSLPHIGH